MPKFTKKRSKKAGLPPGTLVHIGEKKTEEVKITVLEYDEARYIEKEVKTVEECFSGMDQNTSAVRWINVDGIHQIETLRKFGEYFALHPLILEDILNTDQRPKMEDFERYIYIVLKMLYYHDKGGEITTEQVSLILGSHFLISFQEREGDVFNPVKERIRNDKGRIRKMGADYLAYSLLDSIVDSYFVILESLGEEVEFLEEKLVTHPGPETLRVIYGLKRNMVILRKSVWPLREVIDSLGSGESSLIKESSFIYFRDIYDHTIYVIDTGEIFRDMISGMLEIYLSSISNRLNAVMKVLTIIATIFMPLTFIAGVYGMNFKYMPELGWRWGYPTILLVMAAVGVSMVVYFRKKKWL